MKRFEEHKANGKTPYNAYDLAVQASSENGYLADIWKRRECIDVFKNTYSVDDELRQEGEEKRATETAIEMLKDGMDVLLIAKYSKMSVEQVQNIQASMQEEMATV